MSFANSFLCLAIEKNYYKITNIFRIIYSLPKLDHKPIKVKYVPKL